jgi:hypothetical protein
MEALLYTLAKDGVTPEVWQAAGLRHNGKVIGTRINPIASSESSLTWTLEDGLFRVRYTSGRAVWLLIENDGGYRSIDKQTAYRILDLWMPANPWRAVVLFAEACEIALAESRR